jgi:hypothetical protein
MSDTAVNGAPDTTTATGDPHRAMLLDGDAPRLATEPIKAPAPSGPMAPMPDAPTIEMAPGAPSLPLTSPVLSSTDAHVVPSGTRNEDGAGGGSDDASAPAEHPMAHLMPQKSMPSEASRRAAEIRAVKKAKAKKIKIAVAVGALAFTAIVGPPLVKWLTNAINEAGSTSQVEGE